MSDAPETTDSEPPRRRIIRYAVIGLVITVLAAIAVIEVLSALGPATDTLYSNIVYSL